MVLNFKSKLVNRIITHNCTRMGDTYITKTDAQLRFVVMKKTVFLVGSCLEWHGKKKKWVRGEFHYCTSPIPMGTIL